MNKAIMNYEDLLEEQKKMKELLEIRKDRIKKDVFELRQELQPMIKAVSFLGKFAMPDSKNNSAVKLGTGVTIDWILKKVLRSNPLLSLIVPALVKNYSSHYTDKVIPFLVGLKDKLVAKKRSNSNEI